MALSDSLWDGLSTVIKMNDKIVSMAGQMKIQQQKIENLTSRVVRLETALEIGLAAQGRKRLTQP